MVHDAHLVRLPVAHAQPVGMPARALLGLDPVHGRIFPKCGLRGLRSSAPVPGLSGGPLAGWDGRLLERWARYMARGESSSLEANKAALLTWLVPGAAHLWLGRPGLALAAFALVEGLYWAGLELSGGMGFELLDHELRTLLAPALAPETGNLGGFLYQMRVFGYGPGFLRPWPDHMALGGTLTALSGVAQRLLDGPRPRPGALGPARARRRAPPPGAGARPRLPRAGSRAPLPGKAPRGGRASSSSSWACSSPARGWRRARTSRASATSTTGGGSS